MLIAEGICQIVLQDFTQPRSKLGLRTAAKLIPSGKRIQQRLLHDVGGIQFGRLAGIQMRQSQQGQIRPMTFQPLILLRKWLVHKSSV